MPFDPNIRVEESGVKISADGVYTLEKGEHVLTEPQADAILPEGGAPSVPENSPEAAFAKLGGKKVRGATPKPAEPVPDKLAAIAGAKFVGKIPWKE